MNVAVAVGRLTAAHGGGGGNFIILVVAVAVAVVVVYEDCRACRRHSSGRHPVRRAAIATSWMGRASCTAEVTLGWGAPRGWFHSARLG